MYIYIYNIGRDILIHTHTYIYIYIYICNNNNSGTYSSVVRVSRSGGGGSGFNPHHIKLSGLEVRPLEVSGGSPVHLRSKHQELVGKTLWVKKEKQ